MIERTGPQDKPPRRPANYAQKHPIRNAFDNLAAILFGIVILVAGLAFVLFLLSGLFG